MDNKRRELDGLLEAMAFFGKTEGFILTLQQTDFMTFGGPIVQIMPVKGSLKEYL